MTTKLIELIRTTRLSHSGEGPLPSHEHLQLWTTDGKLIVELCDLNTCETLEPPEGFY